MTTSNANEVQKPSGTDPSANQTEPSSDNVKLYLPSVLGYEKIARGAAEALAEQVDMPDERIEDLKTAVAEACMNAIEHGNSLERGINVTVVMKISSNKLEVSVADVGQDTIPENFEPGSHPMRGWGMFLIRNLVDEMEISRLPEGGNEVRMAINLVPPNDDSAPTPPTPASETKPSAVEKVEAQPRAVQPAEAKPSAVQTVEEKPSAVQPAETKPSAVKTVEEKPSAVQPAEAKPSAISPVTERADPPTNTQSASSSKPTPESSTSDTAAPDAASSDATPQSPSES